MDGPIGHRDYPPRLYGRRHGRPLRATRSAALTDRLPEVALALPVGGKRLDPRALFTTEVTEVWLEVGFGSGEHLLGRAAAHPNVGFIGCEPWIDGVAALMARVEPTVLPRIKVLADDARPVLAALDEASINRVFVLFPDPWPKRRHHRRRLIQRNTLVDLARCLQPGGEFLFASDHAGYIRWTLALTHREPALVWRARRPGDWRHPPEDWIPTRYQRKAEAAGDSCHYLRFQRRNALAAK